MTGDPKKLGFKEDKVVAEGEEGEGEEPGALCDVAPTILDLLGLEIPEGKTLPSNVLLKGIIILESNNSSFISHDWTFIVRTQVDRM